jgi:ribosomal-protein-alanine N-acetyltransferase
MIIRLEKCEVRSFRRSDAGSIASHANNRKVWINLRDAFPHPYTLEDAHKFIEFTLSRTPESHFAIVVEGEVVGGIGFKLHEDVERVSAEVGYWLGEAYWGRGIATDALKAMTRYAIDTYGLARVYALPFEWNAPSMRVLEKAGYVLEGRMRRSAVKDGKIIDQLLYAYLAPG